MNLKLCLSFLLPSRKIQQYHNLKLQDQKNLDFLSRTNSGNWENVFSLLLNCFLFRGLKTLLSAAERGHPKAIEDVIYPLIVSLV